MHRINSQRVLTVERLIIMKSYYLYSCSTTLNANSINKTASKKEYYDKFLLSLSSKKARTFIPYRSYT